MGNIFHVRTKRKGKQMNRIHKFLSYILEFMIVVFIFKEETYSKWMDQVERLRRGTNE